MTPIEGGAAVCQVLGECTPHRVDPVSHAFAFRPPLLAELGVLKDAGNNAGTVKGRVGPDASGYPLHLRQHLVLCLGVFCSDRESACPLTIQTKVLRERLGHGEIHIVIIGKHAHCSSIGLLITRGKALVGAVEKGEVVIFLHYICNLLPLLHGGVYTSGVVSASVKKEDRVSRSCVHVFEQTINIDRHGLSVEVAVLLCLQPSQLENGGVVGPRGVGKVDSLGGGILCEEATTEGEGTCTSDRLNTSKAAFINGGRLLAKEELLCLLHILYNSGNGGVLVVKTF
mmetsp:Transcript_27060/g.69630  ORF Transcript_27060/g.69630 Transcript_27060/m.69630 type:complete len:285 (-) Transcript_27060:259-1113(-)